MALIARPTPLNCMSLINPNDGLHDDNFEQRSTASTQSLAQGCADLLNALSTASAATQKLSTNATAIGNSGTTTSTSCSHSLSSSPETTLPPSPATPCSPAAPRRRISWSDQRGKALVSKRFFSKFDEPFRCGSSPYEAPKLHLDLDINAGASCPGLVFDKTQLAPSTAIAAKSRVNKVILESVNLRLPHVFLAVRVANVAFAKKVTIRMTTDNWQTYDDVAAAWVSGSLEDDTERFVATLTLPNYRLIKTVDFCICFQANDQEFWDANDGLNYHLKAGAVAKRAISPPATRGTFQSYGAFL
eukprot:m.4268 g.4268  ORF g.4268 m.4268 type:complete len:302 (-) comp6815_c0_seq1:156-1061(-)